MVEELVFVIACSSLYKYIQEEVFLSIFVDSCDFYLEVGIKSFTRSSILYHRTREKKNTISSTMELFNNRWEQRDAIPFYVYEDSAW